LNEKVRGHKNGNWKGGVHVNHTNAYGTKTPYLRISAGPLRGWYVHELVAMAKIGRPLTPEETVEHTDGDGLNCHPSNLEVVTRSENARLMHLRRNRSRESGAKFDGVPETPVE